jgi:hypothetical protein
MKTQREKPKSKSHRQQQTHNPKNTAAEFAHEKELREQTQHESLGGARTDCMRMRG